MEFSENLINRLHTSFSQYEIPEKEWNKIAAMVTLEEVKKNEYLVMEGNEADKLAFVISGLFRAFYLKESGEERTIVFRGENKFLSAYNLNIKNKYSKFSIQALEDSIVSILTVGKLEALLSGDDFWQIFAGKYYMNLYAEKENRERELLSDDAETKYKKFLIEYPGIEKRINQYHIASYLGISNVSLSRIRSRLFGSNPG